MSDTGNGWSSASQPRRTRRDLNSIFGDGVAFSVMVGLGETYVPAFALAIGMSEVAAGWIVSIPMLVGAVLQLVSPWALRAVGSQRRWVVGCAVVQALVFAAYVTAAWTNLLPPMMLFLFAAVYWGAGLATGPAWNTWVSGLIPPRIRATFFARRSRVAQGAVLFGLVGGGLLLQWGNDNDQLLVVFGGMFAAAGAARGVSALYLSRQSEPEPIPPDQRHVSMRQWLSRLRHGADGRLLTYMLAVQVAVQVSGPFFTPFMLSQLRFSYIEYLALISTSFIAKMLVLPTVGALARRFGAQRLLYAGGFGIIPMAAMWLVSDSLGWLIVVQLVSGSMWAIYELCTFLLLFEHIDARERTSVLTTFNFANAIATVTGALFGGLLLQFLGHDKAAYLTLFALSSCMRVISIIFMLRLRYVTFKPAMLAIRTLAVRPNTGSVDAPIVSSLEEEGTQARRHEGTE